MRPVAFNVIEHGWLPSAHHVMRTLMTTRSVHDVYIADNGDLRVIAKSNKQPARPDHERVGVYDRRTEAHVIAGDIQERLIELFRDRTATSHTSMGASV